MNKKRTREKMEKIGYDIETLTRWKNTTVKEKLDWLDSALKFAKAPKK